MAEIKTQRTNADVSQFLSTIEDPAKRDDATAVCALIQAVTGDEPAMWGDSIVGFGSYHYRSVSGREGDWFLVGFSPRKQNLTVYLKEGFEAHGDLLQRLGRHTTGKSCLYVKRLADVDVAVLRELIETSVRAHRTSGDDK